MKEGNEERKIFPLANLQGEENIENQSGNHASSENDALDGVSGAENGTSNGNRSEHASDVSDRESDENYNRTEGEERNGVPFENGENGAETVIGGGEMDHNRVPQDKKDSGAKTAPKHLINGEDQVLHPHSLLPQPEAPPGLTKSASNGEDCNWMDRSLSAGERPSFGKFLRDSALLIRRISSIRESDSQDLAAVTELRLSGMKVVVQLKEAERRILDLKGRISFFSRSSCRDCKAVRSFFREKGLRFVEINVDVFPEREKELIQRSGSASVPQIFFNEKLIGGLAELNSMRKGGDFEERVMRMIGSRCPDSAPAAPVYGFDDPEEEERVDEMVETVKVLRQRLPIQDRLARMKLVKNCFVGSQMVDVMIQHLDCGRKKAVEIGKVLARRHFIHHVFQENDFEDGNHLYRFLEHEPTIPRCFNFRGATNDSEPKPAAVVGQKLTKIMSAILEAYASEDRRHVDYAGISKSEEFRRYVNLVQDLQRVDMLALSEDEKLAFFLNLYNAMVIHAVIRIGYPEGVIDRRTFYGDFNYIVGGYPYSLTVIKNGILRSNRRQPYSLIKPFSGGDKRLEVAVPKVNPLIHFGLCNGTRSSPVVRFFSPEGIEAQLRVAAREFFLGNAMDVNLDKRTVYFSRIIKWYQVDFGNEKDILKWILNYLDAAKAGLLTHLMSDGGPVNFFYQNYDWSLNS